MEQDFAFSFSHLTKLTSVHAFSMLDMYSLYIMREKTRWINAHYVSDVKYSLRLLLFSTWQETDDAQTPKG